MAILKNIRRLLREKWEGELEVFAQEVVAYFETADLAEGTINFDLSTPESPGPTFVSEPLEDIGLPEIDYDAADASEALPAESYRTEATPTGELQIRTSTRIRRSALLGRVVRQDGDKSYTLDLFPFGPAGQSVQIEGALEAANRSVPAGTMVSPVVRIDHFEVREIENKGPNSRLVKAWVEVELVRRRHYFAPGTVPLQQTLYWTEPYYSPVEVQVGF
jgi:hypothetical protein